MRDFRELLADGRPHVFDGAMGTMLYSRGVYINRCYDELNLRDPDLVRDVHREYFFTTGMIDVTAGSQMKYGIHACAGLLEYA